MVWQWLLGSIVLHFIGSNRRDTPYWRDLTETPRVPDSLAESLEFFKASMPQGERFRNFVFRERSYACLLAGLKKVPMTPNPLIHHFDGSAAKKAFADIKKRTEELVATLPGQREYLTHVYRKAGIEFEAD